MEEHVVEGGHGGADLVERAGAVDPQRGRAPQHVDLLEQVALCLGVLGRAQPGVVAAFEQLRDAPDGRDDGPASGLRRVRREHRPELQAVEQVLGLVVPGEAGDVFDAFATVPASGWSARSPARSERTRWYSSAALTRWK